MYGLSPMAVCPVAVVVFALVVMIMVHFHKYITRLRPLCALCVALLWGVTVWQMVEVARMPLHLHLSHSDLIITKIAIIAALATVSCVFLIGAALTLSKDIEFSNGQLVILRSSLIYKILEEVPFIRLRNGVSLCKLSWIAAPVTLATIVIGPVLALVVAAIVFALDVVMMFIAFLWFGMNPIEYLKELVDNELMPPTVQMHFWDKAKFWPKGILPYICIAAILGGAGYGSYWLLTRYGWEIWGYLFPTVKWLAIGAMLFFSLSLLAVSFLERLSKKGATDSDGIQIIGSEGDGERRIIFTRGGGLGDEVNTWNSMPNALWAIWMILKGHICPELVFANDPAPPSPPQDGGGEPA